MRLTPTWLLFFLFLSNCVSIDAQDITEDNFTELTPDSTKFKLFLEKIYDNSFYNHPTYKEYLAKCQTLLDDGAKIPNKYQLDYALAKVYYEQNDNNLIASLQVLKDAKELLNAPDIPTLIRNEFTYVEAYTLMYLGDYETAQKTFYELLEEGKKIKDTILVTQALYSISELFYMKEDYPSAEEHYLRLYQMKMDNGGIKGFGIQIYPRLVELYIKLKNFEQAEKYNNDALAMVDSSILRHLKADFLLYKVNIELEKSNIAGAKKAYQAAFKIIDKNEDKRQSFFGKSQEANILEKEENYNQALGIYKHLLDNDEVLHNKLEWSAKAHEVAAKMGDFEKAYDYSKMSIQIRDSIKNEKKMQQTELLAIKFETGQKQKANDLLKAEMLKKEAQQNYLYGVISFFILGLIFLIDAFFQKMKYNKSLKEEVENRTKELRKSNSLLSQSNKEMEEFNRILSHDLKEPVRNIVSFSTLAENAIEPKSTAGEYLGYISRSGRQLNQLIEDVSKFQTTGDFSNTSAEHIESSLIIDSISKSINSLIQKKNAFIEHHNLPKIYVQKSFLFLVFKNLIENGIKYNQSIQPRIEIRHRDDGQFHYFEVEDNGIGIDPNFHEKIFNMFQRLNSRKNYEGSGLGLSLARKMMRKMDGDIKILRSEEGKGSVFEISFPMEVTNPRKYKMSLSESN